MDFYRNRRQEYLDDIKIAIKAIKDSLLYPREEILYDLYAIPSGNHMAYYAMIYKQGAGFEMVYARTEIYTIHFEEPIQMYDFGSAEEAKRKPNEDGRIIVGIAKPGNEFVEMLEKIFAGVPTGEYYPSDNCFVLDGCFQALRAYDGTGEAREIIYNTTDDMPIKEGFEELRERLKELYLEVEGIIG